MLLLLINFLSIFVYCLMPHPLVVVIFILSSVSMLFLPQFRNIGFILLLCAAVFTVAMYDLHNNTQFVENKLFDAKYRLSEEYEALKRSMQNKWTEYIAKDYPLSHDFGYRVVDANGDIISWSGSEDFVGDGFYELHAKNPSISVYNNDISMRYVVKKDGRMYYLRHFLSNMYQSQDMKSTWLRKIERKNSVTVTFYVSQGQMYINRELVGFNDIKKGEHVYIAETNTLYTKIDDVLLVKLQSPGIAQYKIILRRMFFFLISIVIAIISFRIFTDNKRLLLHCILAVMWVIAVPLPLTAVIMCCSILMVDRKVILHLLRHEIQHITCVHIAISVALFIPLLTLVLHMVSLHFLNGSYLFGVFSPQVFMYIFYAFIGYAVIVFTIPHIPRHVQEGSALVMLIAGIWISAIMIVYSVVVIGLIFLTWRKTSILRLLHWTFLSVAFFIAFYPLTMVTSQKCASDTALYFIQKSEREVQETIDTTVEVLSNDEQLQWTLSERIHYDDNNFAFYKWSNTPLAQKQYPHFLYFANTTNEIVSSFSYKCSLTNYPAEKSTAMIVDNGNFWMHKMQVVHDSIPVGFIVVGIAKDFWRYTTDIPVVFNRKSSGLTVFSTGQGERPSTHFTPFTVIDNGDMITVWRKKTIYVFFRTFITLCGLLFIIGILKLFFVRSFKPQFDFRTRMTLSIFVFLVLPFVFSTMLIFNNYTSSLTHYIGREVTQLRTEILTHARQLYSRFYAGKYFAFPGAFPDVSWGTEWSLYSGPQRIISYNEDLYRLNIARDYLPQRLKQQLHHKKEVFSYFWGKGIVDVYYEDAVTKGLTIKLRIALDKMQREDFFDTIVLFMGINIVLIGLLLKVMTLFIKKIIYPLNDLVIATKEVSTGNFNYKVDRVTDIAEISVLLTNFNTMIAKLAAYKNNLNETQNFLREIIGSLPIAAVVYDQKRGILLYNNDMEQLAPHIAVHKEPSAVIEIPVDFYAPNTQEVRFKGYILRVTIRHFKYGYICTVSDITSFIIAEKTQVWFDLAQEIAHELKNPLMPLEFSVNRLEKAITSISISEKERAMFHELLEVMREETAAIATLVRDFREMTQKSEADVHPLNLTTEISAVVNGFKPYPIKLSVSDSLPLVYFPVNKLKMILKNILKNAIEAIPETKQIEISVYSATLPSEWELRLLSASEKYVFVHIKDFAGGIRKEIRDQLFEPYYTSKKGGSGLGLYIVKKIMNEYGNDVYVQVRDGDGTDIYLLFTTEHI